MTKPGFTRQRTAPVRQPVLLGLFTGTAVGAGYLLAGVPNVELMTLIIALCGAVLGPRSGFAAGAAAAVIYSLGSPYGLPVPLMLVAQAVGLGAAGLWGALGGNRVLRCHYKGRRLTSVSWAVATGVWSTLIYDVLTNLAIMGAFELAPALVLAGAVPFMLLHLGSNGLIFGSLLPLVLPRLAGLRSAPLMGRSDLPVVLLVAVFSTTAGAQAQEAALVDTLQAVAESDSATAAAGEAAAPAVGGAVAAHGWQRPLWTPFARTALEWLGWYSDRVPVVDGGLGAPAVILGEAGTAWNPLVVRDGIPVGTGHIMVDDPWVIPTEGLRFDTPVDGADGWGGTGGLISLRTDDRDPGKAVSAYRGVKGKHETYFRAIHLLTPQAAWRAAFEFEESLDIEGYNYTAEPDGDFVARSGIEFPGHSRVRQSRTRLFRNLDDENSLVVEYTNGRLTKDSLPAYGAEHLELWDDGLAVTMRAGLGAWQLDTSVFWRNRDVIWGDRDIGSTIGQDRRKLETGREGASLELYRGGRNADRRTGLTLQLTNWYVDDSLSQEAWLAGFAGTGAGEGQKARLNLHTGWFLGPTAWRAAAGADWQDRLGAGPEGRLAIGARGRKPWWELVATYGGRAPRSDELLTPLARDVAGRQLVLLPNADLDREETARLGLVLQARLLGLDLAVDGSLRRLRHGITWRAVSGETDRGRWRNDLDMASQRLTASVGREGRFLGWGRMRLEGTWQQSEITAGRASLLPPARYLRSQLRWENHFFAEDGILQLALFSTLRGEMADPWDVTRTALLPSRTVHDLLVGFRLVGANLSLAFRNLTGERTQLTSGALSTGQEVDMRLYWAWVY